MQGLVYRKSCAVSIVVLFIGISIAPSISGSIGELSTASLIEEVLDISFKLKKTNENDIASYDESAVFETRLFDADNSFGKTIYVDDDNTEGPWDGTLDYPFRKIMDGINNAINGDNVFVFSGIYEEMLKINKSINLTGEEKNTTIINNSVELTKDCININGFTIQNSHSYHSIELFDTKNCIIQNNIIRNNSMTGVGILTQIHCSKNEIIGNIICNNGNVGVYIFAGTFNIIADNVIYNNGYDGISMQLGGANTIRDNIIFKNNHYGISGAHIYGCHILNNTLTHDGLFLFGRYFTIENNTVNGRPVIYLDSKSNMIIDEPAGQIILRNCHHIVIKNQKISHTDTGIVLKGSDNCSILNNNISDNYFSNAIILESSNHNIISNNNLINNSGGIELRESNKNLISSNIITNRKSIGVKGSYSNSNTIENNKISKGFSAIGFSNCMNNDVTKNLLFQNEIGVLIELGLLNKITKNNFINNGKDAECYTLLFIPIAVWSRNYWDRPRVLPKPIPCVIYVSVYPPMGFFFFQFDWFPAKVPHIIPTLGEP